VDVRAERLDPFHREEESDPAFGTRSIDLSRIAADGESRIVSNLLVQERKLVDRHPKRKLRQVAVVEENRGADQSDPAVMQLLPELASENADLLVPVHTPLVEVEKQVEMKVHDLAVNASPTSVEPLERRCHSAIIANAWADEGVTYGAHALSRS